MKWTTALEEQIVKLREEGFTTQEVANQIDSTYKAVEHRLAKLKRDGKEISLPETPVVLPSDIKVGRYEINKIITAIGDNLFQSLKERDIRIKDLKLATKYSKKKKEEQSILDISDVHLGMVNKVFDSKMGCQKETYNHTIFLQEMETLRKSIFEIHSLLSSAYNLKKLNLFILGDIVTNDRIFSGQKFHIDRVVGKQIWDGAADLAGLIQSLKKVYEYIEITCVVGNHGRSTENYIGSEPVENNFEYHLYRIIQLIFDKDPRVKVNVPNTRQHIVEVGGWKHLLQHGDAFRGSTKNYMERQVKDLIVNIGGFDVLETAHVHSCEDSKVGEHIRIKQNGCWISKDVYAFEKYRQYSVPEQHFYGCNKKRIETWSYKVDLRK